MGAFYSSVLVRRSRACEVMVLLTKVARVSTIATAVWIGCPLAMGQHSAIPHQQILVDNTPTPNGGFGWGVAANGNRVAVGAHADLDTSGQPDGTVTVFHRAGPGQPFIEEAVLSGPIPNQLETSYFGHSVVLDGTRLVAAAPVARRPDNRFGILYAYDFDPTLGWIESQQILDPPIQGVGVLDEDRGFKMWMQGDHLFVTSRYASTTGRLLYYHHDGMRWNFVSSHYPPGAVGPISFGWSLDVRIGVGVVVVGARHDSGPTAPVHSGAAYIYRLNGNGAQPYQLQFEQRLLPPAPRDEGQFGGGCAVLGDGRVAVTCWGSQGSPQPNERLYVYERATAGWSLVERRAMVANSEWGEPKLHAGAGRVYLSATYWIEPNGPSGGAVVAFCEEDGFWNVGGLMLRPPGINSFFPSDEFAVGEDFVVVGAPDHTPAGAPNDAGGAVIYPIPTESDCLRSTASEFACSASTVGCPSGGPLPSDPVAGCVNSTGRGGRLVYQGLNWRTFPTGRAFASDLPPGEWCVLLRGYVPQSGPNWNPAGHLALGSGTSCIITPVQNAYPIRRVATNGTAEWLDPLEPGTPATWGYIADWGDVPFQVWYRDRSTAGGATSNTTNVALVTARHF